MLNSVQFQRLLQKIKIVRPPKYRLSTFGSSNITYKLITGVSGFSDRSRLRTGNVTAEKPQIITPQSLKERFEGFGMESRKLEELLGSHYGGAIRGLEYNFRNVAHESRLELVPPQKLTQEIIKEYDREGSYRNAIIHGSDFFWELALMKLIVEETMSSFQSNLTELQDREFFDSTPRDENRRHREIQHLLKRAQRQRGVIPALGQKLKEYGLFELYQDQFFQLLRP